jgi:hypothetical protein
MYKGELYLLLDGVFSMRLELIVMLLGELSGYSVPIRDGE